MKALVIGGCGFIGSHVVDHLVASGIDTSVLDHRREAYRAAIAGVAYHHGVWNDPTTLSAVLDHGGFACVVHLGWTTTPQSASLAPTADAQANVIGSLRLLDTCVRAKVRRVVFAGSGGTVYGPSDRLPLSEREPTEPISAYGIAKLAVEKYLRLYQRDHGLESLILRVSNPYGPRQNPDRSQGAVAVFASRILSGRPIQLWGDGSAIRDYLHVVDVADAFHRAVTGPATGVFNIGSGLGTSLAELIALIERQADARAQVEYRPARPLDVPAVVLDRSYAERVLGWRPQTPFDAGLRTTIAWLRAQAGGAA